MTASAEELLAHARERIPQAVRLARPLSLCVRAEPSLLRTLRLARRFDAAAEGDLWFSELVASAGPLGVALRPAVADLLRAELDSEERDAAWELVLRHHAEAPWSIRLEEQIKYLTAGGASDATAEELVAAALTELREKLASAPREAVGIARWLLTALARLPQSAQRTPTAAAAAVVAGAHLDGRIEGLEDLSDEARDAWLPWLMRGIGATRLSVRWLPEALVLGDDGAGAVTIEVPATEPLVLTAEFRDGGSDQSREIRLRRGERGAVAVPAGPVTLRTVKGDEIVLEPSGLGRLQDPDGRDHGPAFAIAPQLVVMAGGSLLPRPLRFLPAWGPPIDCAAGRTAPRGLALYELAGTAPFVVRLGAAEVGDRWRFADGRKGGGTVIQAADGELLLEADGPVQYEPGLAITLERQWGTVCGALVEQPTTGSPFRAVVVDPELVFEPPPDAAETTASEPAAIADEDLFAVPLVGGALPRIGRVDLAQLGISLEGPLGGRYLPREVDRMLAAHIGERALVVLTGPPGAGIRRTLREAAISVASDAGLALPRPVPGALASVLSHDAVRGQDDTVILWLDPAAAFLGELESAGPGVIDEWRQGCDLCVVVPLEEADAERAQKILERAAGATPVAFQEVPLALSPAELEDARRLMPELELDPENPWSGSELEARERGLERLRSTGDASQIAEALHGLARARANSGRYREALAAAIEGLSLTRRLTAFGDVASRSRLADRIEETASMATDAGEDEQALELGTEAVDLRRELANESPGTQMAPLAQSQMYMASYLARGDRLEEAVALSEEAVVIMRELAGHPEADPAAGVALDTGLQTLSHHLAQAGRHKEALRAAEEAVESGLASAPGDDDTRRAFALLNLAQRQREAGDTAASFESAERAIGELRRGAEPVVLASGLLQLGDLQKADRPEEAIATFEEAVALLRPMVERAGPRERMQLAHPLLELARLQTAVGRNEAAAAAARECVDIWRAAPPETRDRQFWQSAALETAADVLERVGRLDEAIALDDEHVQLTEHSGDEERREWVRRTAAERRARAGLTSPPSQESRPVGTWAASYGSRGATVVLYEDRLVIEDPEGLYSLISNVERREIRFEEIAEIEIVHGASLLRPPTARLHLARGEAVEFGIVASRLSPNFRRANEKALDALLDALPPGIPRRAEGGKSSRRQLS